MKDAYSFDRDEDGLARELPKLERQAYHRMFERWVSSSTRSRPSPE